jgi:hypothetical protein
MARGPEHSPNWGGYRAGGGRNGNPNKYCKELVRRAFEDGEHPFDILLQTARDPQEDKKVKMYAANACLPYCAQKLATIEPAVSEGLSSLSMVEKVALLQTMRDSILEMAPDASIPKLELVNGKMETDVVEADFVDVKPGKR